MKLTKFAIPMMMTALLLGQNLKAEEITLPVISKPAILDEGTQRVLSQDQIAELLPWAKDSKIFLTDALNDLDSLPMSLKVERLLQSIKQVVQDSGSKNSELFMRYVLNRGLAVNDILAKEADMDAVGSIDAQFRILRQTVEMAIKYYDIDMTIINKKSAAPFKDFGVEYFNFLTNLNNSIFDASAQYNVQRTALEFLQWDLYRDLNNKSFAPQIVKINNNLKFFPVKKMRDADSIALIRQMKKVTSGMELGIRKDIREEGSISQNNSTSAPGDRFPEGLKVGDNIMYGGYPSVIVAIRADGQLMVKQSIGLVLTVAPSSIAYITGCVDGFCVGEKVINNDGKTATVTGVGKDKFIYVYETGWTYSEFRKAKELAKTTGCNSNGLCVGNTVIDNSGYPVKITGIKSDNKVTVFKSDWSYSELREPNVLAKVTGCSARNICVGDQVYMANGEKATITGILNSTQVRVYVSGWSYSEIRNVDSLGVTK